MKNKHVFWGIFFVAMGIFILINNLTSYNFYIEEVWKIWPLSLILLGASLLIRQTVIRSILVGLTALVLAFAIYSTFATGFRIFDHEFSMDADNSEFGISNNYDRKSFSEPINSTIKQATLNFDSGAGAFSIGDSTSQLFEAVTEGVGNSYNLVRSNFDDDVILDFNMKKKRFSFHKGHFRNRVSMKLNPDPLWDINLNAGAASLDLDLTDYKIRDLTIQMGAASLKTILGEPEKETHFKLEAGVSSVEILIPSNVGCAIKADVSLSSKHFEGFDEVKDDLYQTANFNNSDKKIYIELSTGVSSLTVKRRGW